MTKPVLYKAIYGLSAYIPHMDRQNTPLALRWISNARYQQKLHLACTTETTVCMQPNLHYGLLCGLKTGNFSRTRMLTLRFVDRASCNDSSKITNVMHKLFSMYNSLHVSCTTCSKHVERCKQK